MTDLTSEQLDILAEAKEAQETVQTADDDRAAALEWRAEVVARGRELGLSQAAIADHIGVKPNVLGQAALRERRRATASA